MVADLILLGEFEQMVLLAVMQVGERAYAVPIHEELVRRTKRRASRGAMYMTLDRLEKKGLLSSSMSDPTPERGGRRRRYFRVTRRAIAALRSSQKALINLWDGLELVER
jgi:DNA-binding PadR family transcriptional regulator